MSDGWGGVGWGGVEGAVYHQTYCMSVSALEDDCQKLCQSFSHAVKSSNLVSNYVKCENSI